MLCFAPVISNTRLTAVTNNIKISEAWHMQSLFLTEAKLLFRQQSLTDVPQILTQGHKLTPSVAPLCPNSLVPLLNPLYIGRGWRKRENSDI